VINEAGVMAMQEGLDYIDMKVIQRAMNRIAFRSLEGKIRDKDEQWKTAVHEAGHAVAALVLAPESLSTATIIPQGRVRGHVRFVRGESITESIDVVEDNAVIALSGSAAEEIILGKRYMSSMDDNLIGNAPTAIISSLATPPTLEEILHYTALREKPNLFLQKISPTFHAPVNQEPQYHLQKLLP
jgi:ATP-dependent Zn protease